MRYANHMFRNLKALTRSISKVFADKEKLLEGARALAKTIASNSPLVVQVFFIQYKIMRAFV